MYEIELKAHVYNKQELQKNLSSFAKHVKDVTKNDTYYSSDNLILKENNSSIKKTVRLRSQKQISSKNEKTKYYFTYKKKELQKNSNGIQTELNEENETEIKNSEAIKNLLLDLGFRISLTKQKITNVYEYKTPFGKALIELCNLPELGDFIEIEILSKKNDEKTVSKIQEELKKILKKCKIPENQIENKYYSELLAQNKQNLLGKKT